MLNTNAWTLREHFATQAMPTFYAALREDLRRQNSTVEDAYKLTALASYEMADAMLAARSGLETVENERLAAANKEIDRLQEARRVDSIAISVPAYVNAAALKSLWDRLGANNQTEASMKLDALLKGAK